MSEDAEWDFLVDGVSCRQNKKRFVVFVGVGLHRSHQFTVTMRNGEERTDTVRAHRKFAELVAYINRSRCPPVDDEEPGCNSADRADAPAPAAYAQQTQDMDIDHTPMNAADKEEAREIARDLFGDGEQPVDEASPPPCAPGGEPGAKRVRRPPERLDQRPDAQWSAYDSSRLGGRHEKVNEFSHAELTQQNEQLREEAARTRKLCEDLRAAVNSETLGDEERVLAEHLQQAALELDEQQERTDVRVRLSRGGRVRLSVRVSDADGDESDDDGGGRFGSNHLVCDLSW